MIGYLSGIIQEKTGNFIIVNVRGVGYIVYSPREIIMSYRESQIIDLYIFTVVREQEISLYGFKTLQERQFFELLISVSGIGPKSALEFLNLPIETIKDAIGAGDTALLSQVKGIGKKTAERLVVELKNKIGIIESVSNIVSSGDTNSDQEASQEVLSALEGLGFERINVVKKLKEAPKFESTEDAVMWFLQNS